MNKLIILAMAVIVASCKHTTHKEGEEHHHDHKNEKLVETSKNSSEKKEEEHNESEIHLTSAQLKSADIVIGNIEQVNMRERIEVTGSIEVPPKSMATVYAPMGAFVHKADLLPGDKVYKGQTVAILQHPNFTNLQYNYLEAINKYKLAKNTYDRKKMLFESDIASKKSFQLAESNYRSAKSLVSSYASQLKMAGLSPKKVANKGIQQYIHIKAPISGYIVKNNASKGKFLDVNFEILEIIDNDHMHAELNVFGTDILRLKEQDEFIFKPNGTNKKYNGYIKLISQKINDKTKTVNVHGHFEDKENVLKAGTFINAEILLGGKKEIAVPEDAIIDVEGENFIFKAVSPHEFVPLEVTIGNSDNDFIALKTIQGNDFNIKIVTKGAHFLKGEFLKKSGVMDGHGHAH